MTLIPLLRRPLRALAVVASLGGLAACDVTPVPEDILPAVLF